MSIGQSTVRLKISSVIRVPDPGADSSVNLPPIASARSRIESSPSPDASLLLVSFITSKPPPVGADAILNQAADFH